MYSPDRQCGGRAAGGSGGGGMPRSGGKLLGWLLIGAPPQQSSAELAAALDLSAGSVSSGTRMLENAGLVRRVAAPGRRGNGYEMAAGALLPATPRNPFPPFRPLMEGGLRLIRGQAGPPGPRPWETPAFF